MLEVAAAGGPGPDAFRVSADHIPPTVVGPKLYYYRSSLCYTPRGQAPCAELEAGLDLRPLLTREFPSIPSHPQGVLLPGPLELGVYEVVPDSVTSGSE